MPIHSYSPSHTEIPDLDRLTTGAARRRLLGTLTEAVHAEVGRESHQHQLLIGPRGSGKTHTLTLVAHRLRTDPELQSQVLPLVLAEEEVASHPADLMRKVLEKLAATLDADPDLVGRVAARRECGYALTVLRSEGDDERALEIAVGALEVAAAALGRLLVAVIENLDTLLYAGPSLSRGTEIEGQWGLRRVLLETRGLLVLGAAPTLFGEVTDPEAPFYDFFRLHHLDELPPQEMMALIRSRLDLELKNKTLDPMIKKRLQALAGHYEERMPKLRGLLVLTGGLPRFAHLIFDLLAETDLASVAGTLSRFLDEQTPYFQSRLDPRIIPKAELEVLDAIASADGPLTPKEVTARLRARAPNAVGTFLKRLRERGLVKPTGPSRRDVRYDLTEPLFRVWRRFRRSQAEQDQVVLLAEFVAAMFDRSELEADWEGLERIEADGLRRNVVETALRQQGWRPAEEAEVLAAEHEDDLGRANASFDRGEVLDRRGDQIQALEAFKIADSLYQQAGDDRGRANAIYRRGDILFRFGDNTQALEAFQIAEALYQKAGDGRGHANAICNRGEILVRLGDNVQALEAFQIAESLYQKAGDDLGRGNSLFGYGRLIWAAGRLEEGLDSLVTAHRLAKKAGHLLNADLFASTAWNRLADVASQIDMQIEPDRFRRLLRLTEPLLQATEADESARSQVVRFARSLLTNQGPEFLLDMLPSLGAGLPSSRSTLLRPLGLAAEVQLNRKPRELPEESEEMRRAVQEVLDLSQGRKIFVSYSHRDEKALEQIQRFLRPLERDGLLATWADTRLEGGEDWRQEIEQALAEATVAVLLISQDFLNSKFITEEEVPRILAREAAGKMTIIPVFLSPSLVEEVEFPDPHTSGQGKLLLTKFQGYGKPNQPLSDLEWSARERIYYDLSRRLRTLFAAETAEASSHATAAVPGLTVTAAPTQAYELTVQLEEREETLLVTYLLPGAEPLASASLSWADLKPRIDSIHQTLDIATNRMLLPQLGGSQNGWGEALFTLLFPQQEMQERIFRAVFGRSVGPRPTPIFGGVRLRILAEDARLSGLPWRLTSWKGQLLLDAGWSFTTTQTADPVEDHLTTAPCNVLIVAPRTSVYGGGPHDPEHAQAVRDVLNKAWTTGRDPGYVQVARTRAQLEEGLRGLRPHILYIYGSGIVAGGRPSLLLEGPHGAELLALAELGQLFAIVGGNPAVVYLNIEGLNYAAEGGPFYTPDQILGAQVPLLLWRRRHEWSTDSTTMALLWLHRWLGQGEDPIVAFHQVQRGIFPPSCEASTVAIHSNFRAWRTSVYQASPQRHRPSLRLDRDHQKSLVRKHLEELVRSGSRRVMALVPYATPGNSIPSLSGQLRHDLDLSLSHLTEIAWVRLQFPEGRANLRRDLEEELKLQLGARPKELVSDLLRRHTPKAVGPGKKPVLWLDWGTFGAASSLQPELEGVHLEAWLRFSSEFLGAHCPEDLRIVSYAALEIPDSKFEDLAHTLKEQRRQPWCRTPAFRLSELPPLGKVGEADLLDFLEDPSSSSCDPGIQAEVAERIIAKTGGTFEETVALLQEAESGSWYNLLAQLRREQV